jgi:hypothetical protein
MSKNSINLIYTNIVCNNQTFLAFFSVFGTKTIHANANKKEKRKNTNVPKIRVEKVKVFSTQQAEIYTSV